jgi:type VI secretion system protein ImpH
MLERIEPERAPVGGFGDPGDEVVRFAAHTSMAFPPSEIRALKHGADEPARMVVNFMGLTGPTGALPLHYTQLVTERTRARDTALRDFFDIFHHRMISLFYRAWARYRGAHDTAEEIEADRIRHHLLDLMGLGTPGLSSRPELPVAPLLAYTGLLGMQARSAVALEALVGDYFGVPVEVEQFVGGWYPLDLSTQCALGDEFCESTQLGFGAVVGDEVWDQQARARIRIGPISRRQYEEFLPGAAGHVALKGLVDFFGGDQIDFEVQLVMAREEVPPCILGEPAAPAPTLGWCSWLNTSALQRDPDETILPLASI